MDYLSRPLTARLLEREAAEQSRWNAQPRRGRAAASVSADAPPPPPEPPVAMQVATMPDVDDESLDAEALEATAKHLGVAADALKVERLRAARFAHRLAASVTPWIYVQGWRQPLRLVKSELKTQLESPAYSRVVVRVASYDRSYLVLGFGSGGDRT